MLLQSGAVLTVSTTDQTSKRYEPNLKQFVQDANLPVMLGDGSEEIGPGITMMNGNVIWFGATGHTCIYTPGSQAQNGKWTQGPDLPTMVDGTQLVCTDTTAILEPNGKVFVVTWWGGAKGVVVFLEYDPGRNQFTVVEGAPNTTNREAAKMLLLPNGHGMVWIADPTNTLYDLTFDSGAQASWAPAITCFPFTATRNQTVTLNGTQLCGLSECQHFGDDNQQAENYPMVRFTDGNGGVTYARAHNVTTRGIAPGQSGSVLVDVPGSLALGAYSVEAVAMGLSSNPVTVNLVPRSLKFAVIMAPANEPYQWWWGQTGEEVGQKLQASKMQLRNISAYVDLDNTVKLTAIMGPPTGQSSWWYWGQTGDQVGKLLAQNKARLTDISVYVDVDGTLKFAVIMAPADQAWWWYWGFEACGIAQKLEANNARPTVLAPYFS